MSDFHLGALVYCAVAVGCSSAPPEAAQVFVPAGDFRGPISGTDFSGSLAGRFFDLSVDDSRDWSVSCYTGIVYYKG